VHSVGFHYPICLYAVGVGFCLTGDVCMQSMRRKKKYNSSAADAVTAAIPKKRRRSDRTAAAAAVAVPALTTAEEFKRELRTAQNTARFQTHLFAGKLDDALAVANECKNELDNSRVYVFAPLGQNPIQMFTLIDDSDMKRDEKDDPRWNEVCELFMGTGADKWILARDASYDVFIHSSIGAYDIPFRVILTYILNHAAWVLPKLLKPVGHCSLLCDAIQTTDSDPIVARLLPYVPVDALDWVGPPCNTAFQLLCARREFGMGDEYKQFISLVGQFVNLVPHIDPRRVKPVEDIENDLPQLARNLIESGCWSYDRYFKVWLPRAIREVLTDHSEAAVAAATAASATSAHPIPLIPDLVDIVIGYLSA
jgi:hypothetical protein